MACVLAGVKYGAVGKRVRRGCALPQGKNLLDRGRAAALRSKLEKWALAAAPALIGLSCVNEGWRSHPAAKDHARES